MGAMLGRVIDDYRGLVQTCQQRAIELEISRLEIDRLAGLAPGYAGKLLGNTDGDKSKRMWPVALESVLGTLGLKILLIEDHAATARTLALRKRAAASQQRLGNKNNSKPLLKIENTEPAKLATPRPDKPAPASRAHLRVVQMKRGRKYG
jgi:phytoene dehydrogenase-like protein